MNIYFCWLGQILNISCLFLAWKLKTKSQYNNTIAFCRDSRVDLRPLAKELESLLPEDACYLSQYVNDLLALLCFYHQDD